MKKFVSAMTLALLSLTANASQNQSYQLITVSTYLNFYLLNLNACEDYHPEVRQAAYLAEKKLYPYFSKLDKKIATMNIDEADKRAIARTVSDRRSKLNVQIAEGEFTIEHCNAVISIVNEGLDSTILANIK